MPAAVLAPAEGAIAELAFVLLFWDERGLPGRSRGSRDGIQSGGRHDCDGIPDPSRRWLNIVSERELRRVV